MLLLTGLIVDGSHDASRWLSQFNEAYRRKLEVDIVPGSLNILLDQPFYFSDLKDTQKTIKMRKEDYGGARDILLRPCRLFDRQCFIWRTGEAERGQIKGFDFNLLEIISDVHLRSTFHLSSGDKINIEVF